ncbi:hypothetical protein F7734_50520 [Scytonema sp. UIC 10036]|uniref:hypothetical protein n=1 Tax=Scytonema sp. UIC 10036 TaxID=2304196 RepID=UPI0012DA8A01|nr:hypothetical protein [Scytonema sp. UIC 10036]MUH00077.1 hypothetical protein [Scytonema sp. UIC 10036]
MMTKGKDGSEQVRIRTEYAEYIRAEGERLEKSFLSTLYWIIDNYRVQQKGIQAQVIPSAIPQPKAQPEVKKAEETKPLSQSEISVDLSEFE